MKKEKIKKVFTMEKRKIKTVFTYNNEEFKLMKQVGKFRTFFNINEERCLIVDKDDTVLFDISAVKMNGDSFELFLNE